jgi:hypothetical protein
MAKIDFTNGAAAATPTAGKVSLYTKADKKIYIKDDAGLETPLIDAGVASITALTGDVTATGPGSVPATLATVNANVGAFTYAALTVNAKGLVTAAASGAAPITDHTGLTSIGTNTHAQIDTHIANTSNPHSVTKTQVGLGNVDNTSDLNKPISTATQTALDLKVDKNVAIVGATKTKITYDAKGLVTAGADIAASDLPTGIDAAKIADGTVSSTEFQYINSLTSNVQTQLNSITSNYIPYVGNAQDIDLGNYRLYFQDLNLSGGLFNSNFDYIIDLVNNPPHVYLQSPGDLILQSTNEYYQIGYWTINGDSLSNVAGFVDTGYLSVGPSNIAAYSDFQLGGVAGTKLQYIDTDNILYQNALGFLMVTGSYLYWGTSGSNRFITDDTTQKVFRTYQAGGTQYLESSLFTQTATGTIANSTTETTISSTGVGTLTLPANFFVAGKTVRIKGHGFHSSTGSPTLNLKVKFGSTVIDATGTHTMHNVTNGYFGFESMITCRTTGASGTVFAQGVFTDVNDLVSMGNTATITVNTTTTQAITITAQWGTANAGNTISLTNLVVEVCH